MRHLLATMFLLMSFASASLAAEPEAACDQAKTQLEMNECAANEFTAADKALNLQYQATRKVMKTWDNDAGADAGAEAALLKAQRAWIGYRDAQCDLAGVQTTGGSMQPMIISGCKADLTRKRTAELKSLAETVEAN